MGKRTTVNDDEVKRGKIREKYGDPLKFDYEAFFAKDIGPFDDECDEIDLREIGAFCRDVLGGKTPPAKILRSVAHKLLKVIEGDDWEDCVYLPWNKWRSPYSTRGNRAISIYFNVEWFRNNRPEVNITDVLHDEAERCCISFESSRADYYAIKNSIDGKIDVPVWVYQKGQYKNTFLFLE